MYFTAKDFSSYVKDFKLVLFRFLCLRILSSAKFNQNLIPHNLIMVEVERAKSVTSARLCTFAIIKVLTADEMSRVNLFPSSSLLSTPLAEKPRVVNI